jgi:hypothetical protein
MTRNAASGMPNKGNAQPSAKTTGTPATMAQVGNPCHAPRAGGAPSRDRRPARVGRRCHHIR